MTSNNNKLIIIFVINISIPKLYPYLLLVMENYKNFFLEYGKNKWGLTDLSKLLSFHKNEGNLNKVLHEPLYYFAGYH